MTSFRQWTLTCDSCGRIYDDGMTLSLNETKKLARKRGWSTGSTRHDEDTCNICRKGIE